MCRWAWPTCWHPPTCTFMSTRAAKSCACLHGKVAQLVAVGLSDHGNEPARLGAAGPRLPAAAPHAMPCPLPLCALAPAGARGRCWAASGARPSSAPSSPAASPPCSTTPRWPACAPTSWTRCRPSSRRRSSSSSSRGLGRSLLRARWLHLEPARMERQPGCLAASAMWLPGHRWAAAALRAGPGWHAGPQGRRP